MLWLYSALTMQKPSPRAYNSASGHSFSCSAAYLGGGSCLISFHILFRMGNSSAAASTSTASCPRARSCAIAHFAARSPSRSLRTDPSKTATTIHTLPHTSAHMRPSRATVPKFLLLLLGCSFGSVLRGMFHGSFLRGTLRHRLACRLRGRFAPALCFRGGFRLRFCRFRRCLGSRFCRSLLRWSFGSLRRNGLLRNRLGRSDCLLL